MLRTEIEMKSIKMIQGAVWASMTATRERLQECPGCSRLLNTQVSHGKCPECGTELTQTL